MTLLAAPEAAAREVAALALHTLCRSGDEARSKLLLATARLQTGTLASNRLRPVTASPADAPLQPPPPVPHPIPTLTQPALTGGEAGIGSVGGPHQPSERRRGGEDGGEGSGRRCVLFFRFCNGACAPVHCHRAL